jgi:serine/threonine-protein kinase
MVAASAETDRTSLDIGDVLADKYELVRLLGSGSMGEVWLAHHRTLRKEVAIKVIAPSLWTNEYETPSRLIQRFRFEAQVTAQLSLKTRHIVSVTDHGESDGLAYIVMELLEGATLEDELIRNVATPPFEVQNMVRQIARALSMRTAKASCIATSSPPMYFLPSTRTAGLSSKYWILASRFSFRPDSPPHRFLLAKALFAGHRAT